MRKLGLLVVLVAVLALALPLAASAETAQTAGGPGCDQWYRIRWGDSLSGIAARFGVSVAGLAALNGIADPNRIITGVTICVSAGHPGPGGYPGPAGFRYMVKVGDTLTRIGAWYGWSPFYLARINGIANPNRIYAGQVLWIPKH